VGFWETVFGDWDLELEVVSYTGDWGSAWSVDFGMFPRSLIY